MATLKKLHLNFSALCKCDLRWPTQVLFLCIAVLVNAACGQTPPEAPAKPLTQEDRLYQQSRARMSAKFAGVDGYELVVDAMQGQEFWAVDFFPEHSKLSYFGTAVQNRRNRYKTDRNSPMTERLHIIWRESDKWGKDENGHPVYDAKIIGDEIIDVGARIPQAVIDELRRDSKGQLRIKFRMSNQGTMLGWDIERRPGYDPVTARRAFAARQDYPYFAPVFSFIGGDFQEAQIVNRVKGKGWYPIKKRGKNRDRFLRRSHAMSMATSINTNLKCFAQCRALSALAGNHVAGTVDINGYLKWLNEHGYNINLTTK